MNKSRRWFAAAAALLAFLLLGNCVAETADFSGIAGTWYTDEVMMEITEEGRFELGWNDGDWTGRLEAEERVNEDGEEVTAYRMIPEEPEEVRWESLELVPDIYHPGRLVFWEGDSAVDVFWNSPVSVAEIDPEEMEVYEPYCFIDGTHGKEGPAAMLLFTLLRPAKDIAVMDLSDQRMDGEGNLRYNGTTLEWWAELDSGTYIIVAHVFEGDLPDLAVNFAGEDGTGYNYAVEISGADGEIVLVPLESLEG